ncbi:hypothetical protein [Lacrimispora xylanolytica]|uniref:Uncharacterized protein n=1 Tax=Lacrimispora xylanolytica TaxID=29375 RepID=A0ABY7ABB7_9FIRM|nr:hypothetical protein [Lacrimispora xylanolytica]WAJ23650.1 hypothetical protein OW255_19170 [Lacrimispora xylanolytica]
MCGSNNIVVNCGCCGKKDSSGFSDADILFDGTADTESKDYKLQKPLTDYKALVVVYGSRIDGSNVEKHEFILYTSDSLTAKHDKLMNVYYKDNHCYRWRIIWHFIDESTFVCDNVSIGADTVTGVNNGRDEVAILRIYGMK